MNKKDNFWIKIIYIVSIIISSAVAFLILGPRPDGVNGSLDVSILPSINASLNALTTALLIIGYFLIIKKNAGFTKMLCWYRLELQGHFL